MKTTKYFLVHRYDAKGRYCSDLFLKTQKRLGEVKRCFTKWTRLFPISARDFETSMPFYQHDDTIKESKQGA